MRRRSGQIPGELVITDISIELLRIAEEELRVGEAKYQQLDVRKDFPFPDRSFDIVLAVMLFNELNDGGVRRARTSRTRSLSKRRGSKGETGTETPGKTPDPPGFRGVCLRRKKYRPNKTLELTR